MFEKLKEDYLKMKLEQKVDFIIDFLKQTCMNGNYFLNNNFYIIHSICAGKCCVHSIIGITKTIKFNEKEYTLIINYQDNSYTINGFDIKTLLSREEENIIFFVKAALPHLLDEILETLISDQKAYKEKMLNDWKEKEKNGKQNFENF